MNKDGTSLVGDYEPGDVPGSLNSIGMNGLKTFAADPNKPDPYTDNSITRGVSIVSMVDEHAGWDGKNHLRSDVRKLVVVGNRQVFKNETDVVDDEVLLETFFHEVAAHQGVLDSIFFNEPKVKRMERLMRSSHSDFWVRSGGLLGASPTDSDRIAKQVADFFSVKLEITLFNKAKKFYQLKTPKREK